jgi:drug/metabolite transporter (DMT)-like permease
VLLRRLPPLHPMSFLLGSFIGAAFILAWPALWEYTRAGPLAWDGRLGAAACYLAVGPAIVAYCGYNRGVSLIGPVRAGQYLHLVPVFGSLLAVMFLGEEFRLYLMGGIALIAAGLLLAQRRSAQTAGRPSAVRS